MNTQLKVLFDASWLATHDLKRGMHGGLRVIVELAKRLAKADCHTCFANIHNSYDNKANARLRQLVGSEYELGPDRLADLTPPAIRMYDTLTGLLGTDRGKGVVRKLLHSDTYLKRKLDGFQVFHSPVDPIPSYVTARKMIRPFLTSLDLIPLVHPEFDFGGFSEYLKRVYDSVDERTIILCISESTRNDLLNYRQDIPPENALVTPLGADKENFYPKKSAEEKQRILTKYKIPFNNYFFTLNHHAKYKNLDHLIRGFLAYSSQQGAKNTGLVVTGAHRDKNVSQSLLAKYEKHPEVFFIEYVSDQDLAAFYSNAIAFIYLSLYEGFGLPVLEAMQSGTPVICSNTSSLPEVIGDCGICIPPTDIDTLSHSIIQMENDAALRELCSAKGLERAKLFSWDIYADQVIKAYKKYAYNS